MARLARTRERFPIYQSGAKLLYENGSLVQTVNGVLTSGYFDRCQDYVGQPVVDSTLRVRSFKGELPWVDGSFQANPIWNPDLAVLNRYTAGVPTNFGSEAEVTAPSGWMLDLVAGTNPSRPVLNIPEAVENIVQLPRMLKSLGDLILDPRTRLKPKGFAGEYLGVQFGWLPLIDDLRKLLDFQRYADKRIKELHQLYSGEGLRRRLKFGDSNTGTTLSTLISLVGGSTIRHIVSVSVEKKQWGTIRWFPSALPPFHPDDASINAFATKLVLGATPEAMAYGLWKVVPWTWLLGWFTNVGKYSLANSWTVPAVHGSGCYMSSVLLTIESAGVTGTTANNFKHGGKAVYSLKTRTHSGAVVAGANVPIFDTFRLSILAALFTQRFL